MTPLEWLTLLYADAPRSLWLTLSTKRDAGTRADNGDPFRTQWFAVGDLALAARAAEDAAGEANVYFGLGLRRVRLAPDQRGCARDVGCIPALWAEVDVAGGTHEATRKAYFPSKEGALEWLTQELPHRPSAVVDSGGGLHAYWVLREPWVLIADDDNEHAAALMRGWQGLMRSQTSHAIDSTHDLARVLRVPGTSNRKNGTVQPVRVVFADGPQYSPSDFDDWVEAEDSTVAVPRDVGLRGSEPPGLKLAAMLEDRRFKATLEERRRDLKDQSRSGYCMSLATQCLMAGWADQEVIDLLESWMRTRIRPGEKPKSLGWYSLTVAKARSSSITQTRSAQAIEVERASTATEPEERMAALSALLGFRVVRIVRRLPVDSQTRIVSDPGFILETEHGSFETTTERLRTKGMFLNDVYGKLGRHVEISSKLWPQVSQAICDSWVTEEAPEEQTEQGTMRSYLREYAERKVVTDDPVQAHDSGQVLERGETRWVSGSRFCDWLRTRKGVHVGPRNAARLMATAGCARLKLDNLVRAGKRTSITFWSVP